MQKLHLVGFTTDHKSLILSARRGARSGGFVLAVDDAVAQAVAEAAEATGAVADDLVTEEALPAAPPKPQSALTVKELQARLRAGRTIESVAAEAGVDAEWVTRFATPVLAEQARVIDATRKATFSRARLGPSALPVGAAVYRNLVAKGISTPADELDQGWSTRQAADGRWLVTFAYSSRGRRQRAVWELDLRRREVKAVDRLAAELAFVAGAPKVSVPAPSKPVKPADLPSDADRANARRVAEVRKQAAAQLTEAARQGSKRSVEAARRAASAKPKKRKPPPAPAPPAPEPVVAAPSPERAPARKPAPAPMITAEDASARPARPRPVATRPVERRSGDGAGRGAAATRAEPTRSEPARPAGARPSERPGADGGAARPRPERSSATTPAVKPSAPAASAGPEVPRPSRALARAISADDELRGGGGDAGRGPLRFRDDLATPAAPGGRNGDEPEGRGGGPAPTPPPRRRREPLRAR